MLTSKFNRVFFSLSFSTFFFYSCSNQKINYLDSEILNEMRLSEMSSFAANSTFSNGTSSEISIKDIKTREKNCSLNNETFKKNLKNIFDEYNNKDLLNHSGNTTIPILSILNKISTLTKSYETDKNNAYACYYPELYLANAILMNSLQKVPLAPFNQETLMAIDNKKDPAEQENWNEKEVIKNSRFAKLNGMIRSASIAHNLLKLEKNLAKNVTQISIGKTESEKKYLIDIRKNISNEAQVEQLLNMANAMSAIGFYERAIYRWNGVTSANELDMPVTLPNESLQNTLYELNSSETKLPLKFIIANDLLNANEHVKLALSSYNCNGNINNYASVQFVSMCAELKTIQEKALKIDLKRLVCSTNTKESSIISSDAHFANYFWEEANCDSEIAKDSLLAKSYLDLNGNSYNFINPVALNPLRLQEQLENIQSSLSSLNERISKINLLQTRDFENKRQEISDSLIPLKYELEKSKVALNKGMLENEFNKNQVAASKILLEATKDEIEMAEIQQKNQFLTYISTLSSVNTLKNLEKTLSDYQSDKKAALNKYTQELCGENGVNNCNGAVQGESLKLSQNKLLAVKNNFKNDCTKLVNHLNTVTKIIGKNGCNIDSVSQNFKFTDDIKEINKQIFTVLTQLPKNIPPTCQAAVISEARLHLRNAEFDKVLQKPLDGVRFEKKCTYKKNNTQSEKGNGGSRGGLSCKKIEIKNIDDLTKIIDKMSQDTSKTIYFASERGTGSNQGYSNLLYTDMNKVSSIASFHTEKIYIENHLGINNQNRSQLANPQQFCQNIVDTRASKFSNLIDAELSLAQLEIQRLHTKFNVSDKTIEIENNYAEKKLELKNQIDNLQSQIKNFEHNLGIDDNIRPLTVQLALSSQSKEAINYFYDSNKNKLNNLAIKVALSKQVYQNKVLNSNKISEKISEENYNILKLQKDSINSSIDTINKTLVSHVNSSALITSITPNLNSFSSDTPKLKILNSLAKDAIKVATYTLLNMPDDLRDINNIKYSQFVDQISKTKSTCSYLASFYDANNCLKEIVILQEKLSFKNTLAHSNQKEYNIKILSNKLRLDSLISENSTDIEFDNKFIDELNKNGKANFTIDHQFLIKKKLLLEEFSNEYYNKKITGISVEIIQENPNKKEFLDEAFSPESNIAFLMHDGLNSAIKSINNNGDSDISSYTLAKYNKFKAEINASQNSIFYSTLGNNFPYLFNYKINENLLTNTVSTTQLPIREFNNSYINKYTSLIWLDKLKNDVFLSSPSKNDVYWQTLTGFISDGSINNSKLLMHSNKIKNCLKSDNLNSSDCVFAKTAIKNSFSGFPFLGKYTFVYAPHQADKVLQEDVSDESKTRITGLIIKFIISN
ncbi:hypothetical protein [Fluviispira multicolorata]|uniref:Uncharacterized protein n=1 Tax=Fluviispira multicolorata TaxID=2654512 RepID=A0A833JD56_9BACT|nr:hypothetical protein [Fluviispira multicolorata]KAB8030735.1 hypothetical protein GCL57_07115 [Fluviispira multicolorata]